MQCVKRVRQTSDYAVLRNVLRLPKEPHDETLRMKDEGMGQVMDAILARLRRAEAEIVLLRRENERLLRMLKRKKK